MNGASPELGFVLQAADSAAFARLSGDFNPLHVDELASRRLQFGGTVCHGVHLVLKSLDLLAARGLLAGRSLQQISAVFQQPVRTGATVALALAEDASAGRLKLSASVEGRGHFSVNLLLGGDAAAAAPVVAEAEPEAPAEAVNADFPLTPEAAAGLAGTVPLRIGSALLADLFPALAAWPEGRALVADLAASTDVVGMRCPGLNSIYSEFKLRRREPPEASPAMAYSVARTDPRFRKVRIDVQGSLLQGWLEAFFRAPPVAQRSLAQVAELTAPGCVAGQRALVVGGSRGLGELVSKMLLAGGAEVTLSYARGRDDAERTVAEAARAGARAHALRIDVSEPLPEATVAALVQGAFTHLYYFATPAIGKGAQGGWNAALFESYCRYYVHGFADVVRAAAAGTPAGAPLQVLYPSTVFLDSVEKGFAEYCAAKAAGEELCRHLALDGRVATQHPRLPRMKTDQNSSFLGPEADDPHPAMAPVLQRFCGLAPART